MTEEEFDPAYRPESYRGGWQSTEYPNRAEAPFSGGGSHLPAMGDGDVEIAALLLASTLGDVYSVRARRTRTGRISFRMVGEYPDQPIYGGRTVRRGPMSAGELVAFIDRCSIGLGGATFIDGLLDYNFAWGDAYGGDPEPLRGFVEVQSDFYPGLGDFYEARIEAWIEANRPAARAARAAAGMSPA